MRAWDLRLIARVHPSGDASDEASAVRSDEVDRWPRLVDMSDIAPLDHQRVRRWS
jgi:hypothetical protein